VGAINWGITIFDARKYWKSNATPEDVRNMPKQVTAALGSLFANDARELTFDDLINKGRISFGALERQD